VRSRYAGLQRFGKRTGFAFSGDKTRTYRKPNDAFKMGVLANRFRARLFAAAMAPKAEHADFEHPRFFIEQSERLSALLNAVVTESSTATDPDACIDYLEITEILVELLDQTQWFSVLSAEQIQEKWKEVQSLLGKVQTIQDAVADWDTRLKKIPSIDSEATSLTIANSRKRTRSLDDEIEMLEASKRRRESEYTLVEDNTSAGFDTVPEAVCPSIERAAAAWWTEPFYD
jgi:hypothetical protein